MKKTIASSPRVLEFKKKQKQARLMKLGFFLGIFVVILVAVSFLASWKKINILDVSVTGNKVIDTASLQALAQKELDGKYFWLIPKSNYLFYPKQTIKQNITDTYKRFTSVSVEIADSNVLNINVSERVGKYTWCGEEFENISKEDQKCYFMDDSGYIFDEAPYFSGDVYFRFYGATTGDGERIDGSDYFKEAFPNLVLFRDLAEDVGVKPVAMHVEGNEVKMYLESSTSDEPPVVQVKTNADIKKVVENLKTALGTDPLKSKFDKNYKSLEYIDLRFGNKVYYKFKNESAPVRPEEEL
jgi:cell division septal protein FtsQ